MERIQTELIARFDSDDLMQPDRLYKQVGFMVKNKGVAVLGGAADLINPDGRRSGGKYVYPTEHEKILTMLGNSCAFAHPAVMYRKDLVLKAGGYNRNARHFEDYDLWVRMAEAGCQFANLSETLICYRVHGSSVSKTYQDKQAQGAQECSTRAKRLLRPSPCPNPELVEAIRIGVNCPWRGKERYEFADLGIELVYNDWSGNFDYCLDLDKPFTVISRDFSPHRRIYATTEPSKFTRYNEDLIRDVSNYYPAHILSWHTPLLQLPQCTLWHALEKWVEPESNPEVNKPFGIGGIFSGKYQPHMDGYALRMRILEKHNEIRIPSLIYNFTRSWQGKLHPYPIPKKEIAMQYAYHLAIENCAEDGYFTEKLIDAFAARCIPLYYGDPDISRHFNLKGLILLNPEEPIQQLNRLEPPNWDTWGLAVQENFELSRQFWSMESQLAKRLRTVLSVLPSSTARE